MDAALVLLIPWEQGGLLDQLCVIDRYSSIPTLSVRVLVLVLVVL